MKREMVHIHKIRVGPSWMDSIVLFLKEDILPERKSKADKIQRKAYHFWLFEDQKLYKCSFSGPYLLCIHPNAVELLQKNYMKGFVADPYITGPSLRDIGGQICKGNHKNM